MEAEYADILRFSIFIDLEVFLLKTPHRLAGIITDDRINNDEVCRDFQSSRRISLLRESRNRYADEEKTGYDLSEILRTHCLAHHHAPSELELPALGAQVAFNITV